MDWLSLIQGLGTAIKDFAAPVLNAIGIGVQSKTQQEVNKSNEDINTTNLDYNTKMTQLQWERDDNAHQREVADLQAAGLSPIASLNGAQTSGALGAPSPIAMEAPQLDFNSLAQSMLGAQALQEQKREFDVTSGQKETELENNAKKINSEIEHMQNMDENTKTELKLLGKQITLKNREIQHSINQLNEQKREFNKKQTLEEQKETYKELSERINRIWDRMSPELKRYYGQGIRGFKTDTELEQAQNEIDTIFESMLEELGALGNQDNSLNINGSVEGETPGKKILGGIEGEVTAGASANYKLEQKRQAIIAKYSKKLYFPTIIAEGDEDLFDRNGYLKSGK